MKLTSAMKRCLRWTLREGDVSSWPVAVCSLRTVRKCQDLGLLETAGVESIVPRMGLAFTKYRLTTLGRSALQDKD